MGRIKYTGIMFWSSRCKQKIVFPSIAVILRSNESLQPIIPGEITSILDKILNGGNTLKRFSIKIDGKKICRKKGKLMGDINMWEFEAKPTLKEIQDQ